MNCPQCYAQTEERWLIFSKFDFCPVCREDVNILAKKIAEEKKPEPKAATYRTGYSAVYSGAGPYDVFTVPDTGTQWDYDPTTHSFKLRSKS